MTKIEKLDFNWDKIEDECFKKAMSDTNGLHIICNKINELVEAMGDLKEEINKLKKGKK
jgi:hypothetical protein